MSLSSGEFIFGARVVEKRLRFGSRGYYDPHRRVVYINSHQSDGEKLITKRHERFHIWVFNRFPLLKYNSFVVGSIFFSVLLLHVSWFVSVLLAFPFFLLMGVEIFAHIATGDFKYYSLYLDVFVTAAVLYLLCGGGCYELV